MEKNIALVSGAVGAVISYLVGGLGMAVTVLIALMALDYATGLMQAAINRELNSRVGFNGFIRKIYYLMMVASVYLIALVIPGIGYAGDGAAIAFCVLEFISITENGTKMGLWMPKFIQDLLAIVKDKAGEGNAK
ncbi:phage holin family protein [Metasolibacillus sp.]|uniref:phage holin family protein n=1 Tax=Metasolibacillus sp. TaxID=2703680 RepID=UPI0025E9E508|nr:phage holin family protein [Metasolibacillus sp.]MCT6924837.1 phage holin family protein [Metasolibacillus sp.]MCT6941105.1 phage holin family protein [Metasolibacillus sp.]